MISLLFKEYLIDQISIQNALGIGFREKTLNEQGERLLAKVSVQSCLK
jgi:hypothetical protein